MRAVKLIILGVIVGALDALVFKAFEFVVNHGTQLIWNDIFQSDERRWVVIPLAVGLSVVFSAVVRALRQPRLVAPKLDPLASESTARVSLADIGTVTVIGAGSLLAGASLGPEASLVAMTGGLGIWAAYTFKQSKAAELLMLASIGGLLVAFFGSLIPGVMPLLILAKKKRLNLPSAAVVAATALSTYSVLELMEHDVRGFGSLPVSEHFRAIDFGLALVLGFGSALLGWGLRRLVVTMAGWAKRLDNSQAWGLSAALFGLGIGLLYFIGGETIQFSGSTGSGELLHHLPAYGTGALVVILLAKLLVTAWSLASGYRGGLVFPSVYMGVALALIVASLFSSASPGIVVGSVAGIFGALAGPVVALVFIAALLPVKLGGVVLAGVIGAAIGNRVLPRLGTIEPDDRKNQKAAA